MFEITSQVKVFLIEIISCVETWNIIFFIKFKVILNKVILGGLYVLWLYMMIEWLQLGSHYLILFVIILFKNKTYLYHKSPEFFVSKIFLTCLELNRSIFSMKCIGSGKLACQYDCFLIFVIMAYLGIFLRYLKSIILDYSSICIEF